MVVQEWRLSDGRYLQIKATKWLVDPEQPWDGEILDAQVIAQSFMEDAFKGANDGIS